MRFRCTTRTLTPWIAVLAILMAALAPAISHALMSGTKASWVEVCTSAGARWVNVAGDADEQPTPAGAHALDHCPYCSLHVDAVDVPVGPAPTVGAALPSHAPAVARQASPRPRHAWASARSRAPPLFS
jgi:hypothetical protein